jgi:hypothetical protein
MARGEDWDDREIEATIDAYFWMLECDLRSEPFVKTDVYRGLARRFEGRSWKAFERKCQNISAVLEEEGFPWLLGLAPLRNYQGLLGEQVVDRLFG